MTTTNKTEPTAETVTDAQIRELRVESDAAGDFDMAMVCLLALGRITYDPLAEHAPLLEACGCTTVDEARAECARVIREAQAQV